MTTETAPVVEQTAPVTEAAQPEFAGFTDPNNPETPKADETAPKTEEPPKPEGEGEQPPAEGEEKPAPKPKQTAAERIAEVVAKQRAAERRAEAAERALAERDKPRTEDAAPKTLESGEPDPTKYDYGEADPQFIRDLARHEARQEFAQLKEQDRRASQVQEVDRSWEAAQDAARSKFADFDEKVWEGAHEGKWACTPVMLEAIKSTETGGEVAYHLASNPDEARRIAALNPLSQVRELGKLEARLAAPPTKEPGPKPKTATDAPPPPDGAARGAGGKFVVSDDTDDFQSFRAKHFSS